MDFNKDEIISLRKKLGWTRGDFARRLGCAQKEVLAWESGTKIPSKEAVSDIQKLKALAEESAQRLQAFPEAENVMSENGLSQVSSEQIDSLKNN